MVQEVSGEADFNSLTRQRGKLIVVDFTATWCGPCKRVAPQYEQLARQHPDVLFLKVIHDNNQEMCHSLSVRSFPTFRFYLEGAQIDETRGANIQEVASKVVTHKAKVQRAFQGEGVSLGGGQASALSAEDARSKRLARFGSQIPSSEGAGPDPETAKRNAKLLAADKGGKDEGDVAIKPPAPATNSAAMDVDPPVPPSDDASGAAGAAGTSGMTRARRAADPELVSQLVDMGFAEVRAKKSLMYGDTASLEGAVNWLTEHQEDADIDDPIPEGVEPPPAGGKLGSSMDVEDAGGVVEEQGAGSAQSLKCDQCGTILKDVTAAELHAHKTGHSEFSESTEQLKPLTPEEKAAKIAKMKELVAARRAAREADEKVDHVQREKARRTMGKEALKTKEEMEAAARKREIARAKKEKEDAARERARLKEEIARDKAERKARGGRLSSKLGVDGYNPSAPQAAYGAASTAADSGDAAAGSGPDPVSGASGGSPCSSAPAAEESTEPASVRVDKAVGMLSKQTVAGRGSVAMKTCMAYIKNALTKPEDEKFRAINLDNKAYKTRVANCIGGTALLKAVGFAKEDGRLYMTLEARDEELLHSSLEKIENALSSYVPTKAS